MILHQSSFTTVSDAATIDVLGLRHSCKQIVNHQMKWYVLLDTYYYTEMIDSKEVLRVPSMYCRTRYLLYSVPAASNHVCIYVYVQYPFISLKITLLLHQKAHFSTQYSQKSAETQLFHILYINRDLMRNKFSYQY